MRNFRKIILGELEGKFKEHRFVYDKFDTRTKQLVVFRTKRNKSFFLSIGFTTSRFEDNVYVAEYYLSKNCIHNFRLADMPFDNVARISQLITPKEREKYFSKSELEERIRDSWWTVNSEEEFIKSLHDNFELIVQCSERFDTQERRNNLLKSKQLEEWVQFLSEVFNNMSNESNLTEIQDPAVNKKLSKDDKLKRIGQSLQTVIKAKNMDINKDGFLQKVYDCYNMFVVKY